MAYNPFNIFRRNQKALFAVLTVFIMIMFTLSSGVAGGDFFDVVMRWLNIKGGKEAVCKIDGHTVTSGELDSNDARSSLQSRRVMANQFMALAADQTTRSMGIHIGDQHARLSETGKMIAFQAATDMQELELRQNARFGPLFAQQLLMRADAVSRQIDGPGMRTEDKDVARTVRDMYVLKARLLIGGSHYFGNAPNRNRRDLIEFMLWEKKADQLGIRFTRDDVKRLLQIEFTGYFRDDVPVRRAMQGTRGFSMEAVLDALAAEFRVRAAQTAVLGHASRLGGDAPRFVTPYEVFEYYREQCSPAIYEVIAVPALAFLDQVAGEPSESEISALYNKHADDEPDPSKERPGFKEPRKIAISYFGVTGEEPYYKALAEEQIKVGEVMAKASGALTVPLPGALGSWAAAAAAPLTLKAPAVDAAYSGYVARFKGVMRNEYSSHIVFSRDILEANWARPGVAAAAVGAFVSHPAAAAAMTMSAPMAYEIRSRAAVGTPLVLGFLPGPSLLPNLAGAAAASTTHEPKPLSIEAMRPELIKTAITKRAKALAYGEAPDPFSFGAPQTTVEKGDIARFIEELKKVSEGDRTKDKAETVMFIEKFLADRRITLRGTSTAPRDEWTIEDDPNLAPLVKAQKEALGRARGAHGAGPDPYIPFGQSFFWTTPPFGMGGGRRTATTGTFLGESFPPRDRSPMALFEENRTQYVYWRTEDIGAKKTTLNAARPAVVAAWKRGKARELALARANRMADTIRARPSSEPLLLTADIGQLYYEFKEKEASKNPKADQRTVRFTINGVCPLVLQPGMQFGQPPQLAPFMLSPSENMPYPTLDMEKQLLETRDKPAKTVLVLPDAAKDVYYVATLVRRDLKGPDDFKREVYGPGAPARPVLSQYQREAAWKSRQSVVELLKKEFRYEETEEQKKKLDESVKASDRGTDF